MSGPKVVRIVTREEVIANCRGQLARLDAALAAWTREGSRTETVSEADVGAAMRRRDRIADLMKQDRFVELQKAVPEEIAFLQADRQDRLNKAALAEARARTAALRQQDAAAALLNALRRAGRHLPEQVESALAAASQGKGDVAAAISAGFALLTAPSEGDRARLQALARELKGDDQERSLSAWLESQPPSQDQLLLTRIEGPLAELATMVASADLANFEARVARLRRGEGGMRRSLLLDSLAFDLAKALADARRLSNARESADLALAELRALDEAAAQGFGDPLQAASFQDAEARRQAIETEIASARDAQAAEARRRAVLDGLVALGYEVGEHLSTAWVQDGRIVLRRPSQPGYGVEVAGGANAERLQMRVVAFEEGAPDPARDRDAETLWCGDVAKLKLQLAAAGGTLTIEKALAVGAAPIKRVPVTEDRTAAREEPAPQTRVLD